MLLVEKEYAKVATSKPPDELYSSAIKVFDDNEVSQFGYSFDGLEILPLINHWTPQM